MAKHGVAPLFERRDTIFGGVFWGLCLGVGMKSQAGLVGEDGNEIADALRVSRSSPYPQSWTTYPSSLYNFWSREGTELFHHFQSVALSANFLPEALVMRVESFGGLSVCSATLCSYQ